MNEKIRQYIRREGYCCMWAWLEAHRKWYTGILMERLEGIVNKRALQYQRANHRKKLVLCEQRAECLKKRIKDGHTIHLQRRTEN